MTPKQSRFVEEYLVDLNGARAARRAGYADRSAATQAYSLLQNKTIAAAIATAQAERAARTGVTSDRVVIELAKVAFGDPRRLLSWGSGGVVLRDSDELTEAEAALVSEVAETRTATGGTRRVKLHCKMTALTALARHLGLFVSGGGRTGDGPTDGGGDNDDQPTDAADAADAADARERLARRIVGLAARLRSDETAQ